jgi:hypothetical protein
MKGPIMNYAGEKERRAATTRDGWEALTDAEKVAYIVDVMDESRMSCDGGYPSEYVIDHGRVCIASEGHNGRPELTVLSVAEFIAAKESLYVAPYFEDA